MLLEMKKIKDDAKRLHDEHMELHKALDEVESPHLSQIKEISKRIHFAEISSKQQERDNKGNAFYKLKINDFGDYYNNLTLSYTVKPKSLGVVYGLFTKEKNKDEETIVYKAALFNNYARFIVDVITNRVIYAKELDSFVIVGHNTYTVIDDVTFKQEYPVENKIAIYDFMEVMKEIYRDILDSPKHIYKIFKHTFAGNNWIYDVDELKFKQYKLKDNELYFLKYDVNFKNINLNIPNDFFNMVAGDESSKHNLKLMHAYTMLRKADVVPAEKSFIIKDFGRSGKGYTLETFYHILKVNSVNMDSLMSGSAFEVANAWLGFHGADVAHANETGAIASKNMRVLRKISTSEMIHPRGIGKDGWAFKNRAVLILDTNEDVDIGDITANRTRMVKIAFKDRPKKETDAERYEVFAPYWDFLRPNGEIAISACISYMIASLEYLKAQGGIFEFSNVTLKSYYSADEFTQTQEILIEVISRQGFVPSNDELLQFAIQQDYSSMRTKAARDAVKKIGVVTNQSHRVDGEVLKVNKVGNEKLFNDALKLWKEKNDI